MHTLAILAVVLLLAGLAVIRTVPRNTHIVDGDTLEVRGQRWRLTGFDAPEFKQPGGTEATRHIRHILANSRKIAIVSGRDAYGRRLACIVTLRGPLSWRMIASGNAHPLGRSGLIPLVWARLLRKGVWKSGDTVVNPRTWRLMHPRVR